MYFPEVVGKFAVLFLSSRMCVTIIIIEIFGIHLKFFFENEPALYGFTGAKTGSTFRFLFLLEHVLKCVKTCILYLYYCFSYQSSGL